MSDFEFKIRGQLNSLPLGTGFVVEAHFCSQEKCHGMAESGWFKKGERGKLIIYKLFILASCTRNVLRHCLTLEKLTGLIES